MWAHKSTPTVTTTTTNAKNIIITMGNANCSVASHIDIVVMTSMVAISFYHGLHEIVRQESIVEAAPDAWGLNVAIGYSVLRENRLLYRCSYCPNGGLLTLEYGT
jgi:hypothetical protein